MTEYKEVEIVINDGINGDTKVLISCPVDYDESIITYDDVQWDNDIVILENR